MRRPMLFSLLLAGTIALCPAADAAASPAGPINRYFEVTAQATQRTSWRGVTTVHGDCTETVTTTPQGTENVKLAAPKLRVLVQRLGGFVTIRTGTWSEFARNTGGWTATGSTDRRDTSQVKISPGNCGNEDQLAPLSSEDCGLRSRLWEVTLAYEPTDRRLRLESYPSVDQPRGGRYAPFNDCPVQTAGNTAQPDSIASLDVPLPKRVLSGGFRPIRFGGFRRWYHAFGGAYASTTVTWKLTFKRIKRR